MSYKFQEGVTVADVAFSAQASTLEQLLVDCAKATFEVMVKLGQVEHTQEKAIVLEEPSAEKLLFSWLEELVYLKDAEGMVFSKFVVEIKKGQKYFLKGKAWGENIQPKKHTMNVDVKAVTYHHFSVKEEKGKWTATVVLDI